MDHDASFQLHTTLHHTYILIHRSTPKPPLNKTYPPACPYVCPHLRTLHLGLPQSKKESQKMLKKWNKKWSMHTCTDQSHFLDGSVGVLATPLNSGTGGWDGEDLISEQPSLAQE